MSTIAEQLQTIAENIPKVYEAGQKSGSIDVTAEVGQTIIVKEVDENGKPTKWESAEYQPRVCWTEVVELLPETAVDMEAGGIETDVAFAVGDTYYVKWNGTAYTCVAESLDGIGAIGNVALMTETGDTGEPFVMFGAEGMLVIFTEETAVTLAIEHNAVTPIPKEYLKNALTYYVTQTYTEDNSMTCAETVAEIEAIYASGMEIRCRASTGTSGDFYIMSLYYVASSDNGTVFGFECGQTKRFLNPQADGTYVITTSIE